MAVWPEISSELMAAGKLVAAFLIALPIGWERERAKNLGLRTFPLLATASCAASMLGYPNDANAQARIVQGVLTGIGFVGGAAIFRSKATLHGTATAASIWNTGVLGISVAQERWALACVLMLLNLLALRVMPRFKDRVDEKRPDRIDERRQEHGQEPPP